MCVNLSCLSMEECCNKTQYSLFTHSKNASSPLLADNAVQD